MRLGLVGLGRMGANMARRWLEAGHECVGYARNPAAAEALRGEGLVVATSLDELVGLLPPPRAIWIMIPAAAVAAKAVRGGTAPDAVRASLEAARQRVHY